MRSTEENQFWNTGLYTPRAKRYFDKSVNGMQKDEKQLKKLG